MPCVAQLADDLLDAGDRHRVDARERLVEQDDLAGWRPGSGRFPAAAARRRRATWPATCGAWRCRTVPAVPSQRRAASCAVEAEHFHHAQQVLLDRELAEDARLLGQIAHAAVAGAAIHGPVGDVDAVELAPCRRWARSCRRSCGSWWSCRRRWGPAGPTISPRSTSKVDAVDHAPPAVDFHQSLDFEHRHGRSSVTGVRSGWHALRNEGRGHSRGSGVFFGQPANLSG